MHKKVLKIALHTKRRPWLDGVFAQIKNTSPPFQYSNVEFGINSQVGLRSEVLAPIRAGFGSFLY